jgi:beta-glucuronidase
MKSLSRRQFLLESSVAAAAFTSSPVAAQPSEAAETCHLTTEVFSLCGQWKFRVDRENIGTKEMWSAADYSADQWHDVNVPHTWQIDPEHSDYRGIAWYRRAFDALPIWHDSFLRLEFEAVFHTATIWVNGQLAGSHSRKGYTSFLLDIGPMMRRGQPNVIAVRVDNAFDEHMLPRGRSSDWANDGGIFRPVQLLVTPKNLLK